MIKVLSIDLDYFWSSSMSNEMDPKKILTRDFELFRNQFDNIKYCRIEIGIDHSELLYSLDKLYKSDKFQITNLDAHHDLFLNNYKLWLIPGGTRGKHIEVGNFFFFLFNENKLDFYEWIIPHYFDLEQTKSKLKNQLGNHYFSLTKVSKLFDHIGHTEYDLVFVSISPEWIPINSLSWIEEFICLFNLKPELIDRLLSSTIERWKLRDDIKLIRNHRFKYPGNFCNAR